MENEKKKKKAIDSLANKYYPAGNETERNAEIEKEWKLLCMIEFSIEYLSGKEALD